MVHIALPNSIDAAAPAGTDSPGLGDNQIRALKQLLIDIFGLPSAPTTVDNLAFTYQANGRITMSRRLSLAEGAAISSAAALTPGVDGNFYHITGTTGTTSIASIDGAGPIWLVYDDAVTITHDGTSLILQGAVNCTTVAGDVLCFMHEGSGNYRELFRTGSQVFRDLAVNGGDMTTTATTFNLLNATATTVNFAGAATTLNIGAATGTCTIANATVALTGATAFNCTPPATFTGDIAVNGGDMTTTATTFNLLNATATTVNFAGAGTAITIGETTGYTNIRHTLFINDTANANMTTGLTINQGAADNEIMALKSSDVAHGFTTLTETDTYGRFLKAGPTGGGLLIEGYEDAAEQGIAIQLQAHSATAGDVTKSTAGTGLLTFNGWFLSGTNRTGLGANENIAVFRTGITTRFILDSDGDSHQDVGTAWTNFDNEDDLALLNILSAHVTRRDDPLRASFGKWLEESREPLERNKIVTFNDKPGQDGHHFINWSRTHMLEIGAIRQIGIKLLTLEEENNLLKQRLETIESRVN